MAFIRLARSASVHYAPIRYLTVAFAAIFALALLWCTPSLPAQSQPASTADLQKLSDEATAWLRDLIRINTTNPPGNELAAARYLSGILTRENVPNDVFETAPGRGLLIARLNAGPISAPTRALLLMGHLDVVGAQKSAWSVDPFAAVVRDGYLYGRGAIDDKGMTIANIAVMVELKRAQIRLTRDVVLLAEGDEEQSGEFGMDVAIHKYWDRIAAHYALNEGGRVMIQGGKVQYVGIQASEKVPVNVDVIAKGTSGHASIPLRDNAVVHLAAAIEKIGAYQAPVQLNSVTRAYFDGLAQVEDDDVAKWMRVLDTPDRGEHAARVLSQANPVWNSMLRDSVVPTMLQAGIRPNVIPPEARATLNIRLLPGNQLEPLLAALGNAVNDPQVRFEKDPSIGEPAPSSPVDGGFFAYLQQQARQEFGISVVIPLMSTGGTDAAVLRERSVEAYGLLPFPLTNEDIARMHGNDERIPVASFRQGVDFLYRVVSGFATQPQ
jgi:acetylornithine deacetylase/succinyl-diaminopimelate desuccinylase-like protein